MCVVERYFRCRVKSSFDETRKELTWERQHACEQKIYHFHNKNSDNASRKNDEVKYKVKGIDDSMM